MKKVLSLLALVGLSLNLAACGGQDVKPSDEPSTGNPTDESKGDSKEELVVKIGTHVVCGEDPYDERVGTEGCMSIEEAEPRRKVVDRIREEYGIVFEYVGYQTDDKVEEIVGWNLAGTADADIVRLNADEYNDLVDSGNLTDITKFIDAVSAEYDVAGSDIPYRLGYVGNSNYGIVRDNMVYPQILVFDMDILKDAGMEEMPNELWARGDWNFETAREYFKKVQQYADSSNELTYAFGAEPFYVFKAALGANGVKLVSDEVSNVNTKPVYDTMSYLETLKNDGVLNIYTRPYTAEDEKFKYALTDMTYISGAAQSGWEKGTPDQDVQDKDKGGTAFTLLDMWRSDCCISESDKEYGIVPFPENSDNAFVPVERGDVYAIPISIGEDRIEDLVRAIAVYVSEYIEPAIVKDWAERNFPTQDNAHEVLQYLQDEAEVDPYLDYSGGKEWNYSSFVAEWFVDPTTLTSHLETLDEILNSNLSK